MRVYHFQVKFKTQRHGDVRERKIKSPTMPGARLQAITKFNAHEIISVERINKTSRKTTKAL